mmetsp:Transcript_11146/g.16051  ORF Transcript_11146/g.16051 Transcript_11146/m.16051 type:complete len:442 (+) Transcript_11146:137-1462(+)
MQTLIFSTIMPTINGRRLTAISSFASSRHQVRCFITNFPRKRRNRKFDSFQQQQHPRILTRQHASKKKIIPAVVESTKIPEPSKRDLRLVALNVGVPFIGFGIMDNALLIVAGDAIDASLGVALNISTMCAAALGNIVSDIAGVLCGTIIEDFCTKIGLPTPKITEAQRTLRSVRHAGQMGCAIGITIGCFIGMFPLLFINSKNNQRKKKAAHVDRIFRDAVTEAKRLIQAETITLFLLRDSRSPDNEDDGWKNLVVSGTPFEGGQYLWAKYADGNITATNSNKTSPLRLHPTHCREIRVPIGRGIMNHVIRTGNAINLIDPLKNPDFDKEFSVRGEETKSIMIVPLKNARGEIIGLLQAVNKQKTQYLDGDTDDENNDELSPPRQNIINDSRGFTNRDMQIICALASHMSVYLLNLEDEEKISLKETIHLLRRHTYRDKD